MNKSFVIALLCWIYNILQRTFCPVSEITSCRGLIKGARYYFTKCCSLVHFKNHHSKDAYSKFQLKGCEVWGVRGHRQKTRKNSVKLGINAKNRLKINEKAENLAQANFQKWGNQLKRGTLIPLFAWSHHICVTMLLHKQLYRPAGQLFPIIDIEYNKKLDHQRPCLEDDLTAGSNL